MTGKAPTSGNVHENERRESGSRVQSTIKGERRKRREEGRFTKRDGSGRRIEKTMELQFFILEEESNKKA